MKYLYIQIPGRNGALTYHELVVLSSDAEAPIDDFPKCFVKTFDDGNDYIVCVNRPFMNTRVSRKRFFKCIRALFCIPMADILHMVEAAKEQYETWKDLLTAFVGFFIVAFGDSESKWPVDCLVNERRSFEIE